jgi:DNA-binding transcriptional ArsR family regulator
MEDRIVLDRKAFEALAADTRVKILKSLKQRRKTLSELSKELSMSVSGTKEHLQNLEEADLIVKMDDGHKWKYYELTRKGKEVVGPKEIRVWILLSISAMALIVSMFSLLSLGAAEAPAYQTSTSGFIMMEAESPQISEAAPQEAGDVEAMTALPEDGAYKSATAPPLERMTDEAPQEAATQDTVDAPPVPVASMLPDLRLPLLVGVVSLVSIFACLGILVRNRMS